MQCTICAHAALGGAVSQTEPAYSLGHSPSQSLRTLTCNHTTACNPSLPFELTQPPYSM